MNTIKDLIKVFLFYILNILTSRIPRKKNKKIMILTYDNPVEFERLENLLKKNGYFVVYGVYKESVYKLLKKRSKEVILISKFGKNDISNKIRSLFQRIKIGLEYDLVFTTHTTYLIKGKNQKIVLLWHGMFQKKISRSYKKDLLEKIKRYFEQKIKEKIDYIIVRGEIEKFMFSSTFCYCKKDKFLKIGSTRYSLLKNHKKKKQFIRFLERKKNLIPSSKILLYLPTFRPNETFMKNILKKFYSKEFRRFLEKYNYSLIIKLHPRDENILSSLNGNKTNRRIIYLKDIELIENNLHIYSIFKNSEIMITDYSGVYYDFLNVEKPIIFFTPDFEEYKKEVGFEYKFDLFSVGMKCTNIKELIDTIRTSKKTKNLHYVNKLINENFKDNTEIKIINMLKSGERKCVE